MRKLALPVITDASDSGSEFSGAGTAGLKDKITKRIIKAVEIDENSLRECLTDLNNLASYLRAHEADHIKADTISFKLGVTQSGKVGFMGSGIDIKGVSELSLNFKLK
jgi:hypothetical protein